MATLTFLGAAGTVTGSKHLLEVDGRRVLVDCGLFQGLKELRLRNWRPFPIPANTIDALVLTHAHLDHCGYIPRLVAAGFRGRIFCTPATKDLCSIVLPDAAHIQEEDARDANRHGYSKHAPALPLYTAEDATRALMLLQPVGYERPVPVLPGVEAEFINAGHLLGSAYARVRIADRIVLFGGDLGRYERPVLPDPTSVQAADVLLLESTYGNRFHPPDDQGARLAVIVKDTAARGGKLIIPAFAIGRVEEVLFWLKHLEDTRQIPVLPVYLDSPMAARALQFYAERSSELDPVVVAPSSGAVPQPARGRASTSSRPDLPVNARRVSSFATTHMVTVATPQQSKELVASKQPAIVIASSGMATGGRVLYHLSATLPDTRNTVLFVGFQAAGTRGRMLVDGARQIRMKGRDIPVQARVEHIDSMSAHADAGEIMRWLSGFQRPPSMTYLVHGEPPALEGLRDRIEREKGWPVHIATFEERVTL